MKDTHSHVMTTFLRTKTLITALFEMHPGHPLLEYATALRGEMPWMPGQFERYQAEFNPTRMLLTPEIDAAYNSAVEAAIKQHTHQAPAQKKRARA